MTKSMALHAAHAPVTPERLRQACGAFATGVAIVTARNADGGPVGMTANSFTTVSLTPPLVLWCAQRGIEPFDAFAAATHYAVHVLGANQRGLSDRFADPAQLSQRFEGLDLLEGIAGLPVLQACPTVLQCQVVQRHTAGDHLILVGQVLAIAHQASAPLLYHAGRYLENAGGTLGWM